MDVPSGTTEKELKHCINQAIMQFNIQSFSIINKQCLIFVRTQSDQETLTARKVQLFINGQYIHPFIPKQHLIDEFNQLRKSKPIQNSNYERCKDKVVEHKEYVYQQEGADTKGKQEDEDNIDHEALEDGIHHHFNFDLTDSDAVTWYQIMDGHNDFILPFECSDAINNKSDIFKSVHHIKTTKFGAIRVDFNANSVAINKKIYSLKRTNTLCGKLKSYGIITFGGFYGRGKHQLFICDGKYHEDIQINDEVHFKLFEIISQIPGAVHPYPGIIKHKTANKKYMAYDIEKKRIYNAEECDIDDKEEQSASSSNVINQKYSNTQQKQSVGGTLGYTARQKTVDNCIYSQHPEYGINIFEGVISNINNEDSAIVGTIKSYPYFDVNPAGIILTFHSYLFIDLQEVNKIKIGATVSFCIGKHKDGGYIAYDLFHSNPSPSLCFNDKYIERKCVGVIFVEANWENKVWLQNIDTGNLSELTIDSVNCKQYRKNAYGRYNEKQILHDNGKAKECVCADFILVRRHKHADNDVLMYLGKRLHINSSIFQYKFIHIPYGVNNEYSDAYIAVQVAEIYVNGFLNTFTEGRLYIGIDEHGVVQGLRSLTKEKRAFIRQALGQRLHYFKPKVEAKSYRVKFVQVIDSGGYELPDRFLIQIDVYVDKMMISANGWFTQHHIWYKKPAMYDQYNNHEVIQCPPLSEQWRDG